MSASRTEKHHTNFMSVIVFLPCLLLVGGNAVLAEPYLQLDAKNLDGRPTIYLGGSEDEESIFVEDCQFTLYALVNSNTGLIQPPNSGDGHTDGLFYLSFAVVPKVPEDPAPTIGSFTLNGTLIDVVDTGLMEFGRPPVGEFLPPDELNKHSIFETWFYEHEFELDPAKRADLYNSQDNPGGLGPIVTDGDLWFQDFDVDVSGLDYGYALHIDLYTKEDNPGGLEFSAPFSKDVLTTPTPGAVILGILGLGVVGLKLRKFT